MNEIVLNWRASKWKVYALILFWLNCPLVGVLVILKV